MAHASEGPPPAIRAINPGDVFEALAKGFADFHAKPSHIVFLAIFYPIFGLAAWMTLLEQGRWPWLFPLAAGFSLIGPVTALVFYEMSRRRELGLNMNWGQAIRSIRRDSIQGILTLTVVLFAIFAAWLWSAEIIYNATMGPDVPPSILDFARDVILTEKGHQLFIAGNAVGFFFALLVLMMSAVSFPMLLDRPVSAARAMATSIRAFLRNPVTMLVWGAMIVVMLGVGFALLLFGLAVTLPVLGHASWHLYRRVVEPAETGISET